MNVLFVCTVNVTRSMAAEYVLKDVVEKEGISSLHIASAGTEGGREGPWPYIFDSLDRYGIDARKHRSQPLPKTLMDKQDVIIAMAKHHKAFVEKYTDVPCYLYNELAIGKTTNVDDDMETTLIDDGTHTIESFLDYLIDYLHETMPVVLDKLLQMQRNK